MKQIIPTWFAICLFFLTGNAQENTLVHKVDGGETLADIAQLYNLSEEDIKELNPDLTDKLSVDDVIIIPISAAKVTYIVKSGDTKYSLSHKFHISIAELEAQNPHIVPVLKVGQRLVLEDNFVNSHIDQDVETYTVKSGDTKYSLSKRFGVTITQLEKANPQIVLGLLTGQVLSLPKNSSETLYKSERLVHSNSNENTTSNVVEHPNNNLANTQPNHVQKPESLGDKNLKNSTVSYEFYTIQPGETLYGLSRRAGMSIEEFKALNPKLSVSVQAGMNIKMPSSSVYKNIDNTEIDAVPETSLNYSSLTQTLIFNKKRSLLFCLPFSENKFSEDGMEGDDLSDFIKDNRDFFRGALMAIDSIKAMGLNVDFDIVEVDSNEFLSKLKTTNNVGNKLYNAVILPFYNERFKDITTIVDQKDIPIIVAYNEEEENKKINNLFEAVPSVKTQHQIMLDYLVSKADRNLIVISDKNRTVSQQSVVENDPKTRFVYVEKNGSFNSEDLIGALRKNMKNYVVIDSERNNVFISATNTLLRELSSYSIQLAVLDSSLIPSESDVSINRFIILDMLYPSLLEIDASFSKEVFSDLYKKQYYSEPVSMSMYGFDITFDTLLRLFQAEDFEQTIEKRTRYNTLDFNYSENDWGYYTNLGVNILKFKSNGVGEKVN